MDNSSGETALATTSASRAHPRPKKDNGTPRPTSTSVSPGSNRVVFSSSWGGGSLDQLGRDHPREGNPIGPMSLAVDAKGRVYVLDEINGRIVRRDADGKPERETKIDLRTPEDIVVAGDGSMAVLDRHSSAAVALYDENGKLKGTLPLVGDGLDDPGEVTGVFTDGNSVYAEREHGPLVKLGDTSGAIARPQTQIPGRPSRDGQSFLNAGITDAEAGRAWVSAIDRTTSNNRFTRELRMRGAIHFIVLLDSDTGGTIYFGAEIQEAGSPPVVQLVCLEPTHGEVLGSVTVPANTMPEETFRDFVVLDDGGVLYAVRTPNGVTYYETDCS
jgi:sugar lactone lactonase YvrE